MLKNLSAEAKLLRAVNCVINDRGKLRGDNTDARGLEGDLRALGHRSPIAAGDRDRRGGAAAAAAFSLARGWAPRES